MQAIPAGAKTVEAQTVDTQTVKAETVEAHVSILLDGARYEYTCPAGQTLLQAALDARIPSRYSCTKGHCGTCTAKLLQGAVTMKDVAVAMKDVKALSRRDREQGLILPCSSFPITRKIELDYDY